MRGYEGIWEGGARGVMDGSAGSTWEERAERPGNSRKSVGEKLGDMGTLGSAGEELGDMVPGVKIPQCIPLQL